VFPWPVPVPDPVPDPDPGKEANYLINRGNGDIFSIKLSDK